MNVLRITVWVALFLMTAPEMNLVPLYAREAGWVPLENNTVKKSRPAASPSKARRNPSSKSVSTPTAPKASASGSIYAGQPPVSERELEKFLELLPYFRAWAHKNGEEAHPIVNSAGEPDFLFSDKAQSWIKERGMEGPRFFCIMGRMAAGMVIVEEGNDYKGTRPPDMPEVSSQELNLVRRHLGELLNAGKSGVKIN